jgi:hypothetical protein
LADAVEQRLRLVVEGTDCLVIANRRVVVLHMELEGVEEMLAKVKSRAVMEK